MKKYEFGQKILLLSTKAKILIEKTESHVVVRLFLGFFFLFFLLLLGGSGTSGSRGTSGRSSLNEKGQKLLLIQFVLQNISCKLTGTSSRSDVGT